MHDLPSTQETDETFPTDFHQIDHPVLPTRADLQVILEKLFVLRVAAIPIIVIVAVRMKVLIHARRQEGRAVLVRGVVKGTAIARRALEPTFLAAEIEQFRTVVAKPIGRIIVPQIISPQFANVQLARRRRRAGSRIAESQVAGWLLVKARLGPTRSQWLDRALRLQHPADRQVGGFERPRRRACQITRSHLTRSWWSGEAGPQVIGT